MTRRSFSKILAGFAGALCLPFTKSQSNPMIGIDPATGPSTTGVMVVYPDHDLVWVHDYPHPRRLKCKWPPEAAQSLRDLHDADWNSEVASTVQRMADRPWPWMPRLV